MEYMIYFESKPSWAFVAGKGYERIKCVPIVYGNENNYGLGLLYEDGERSSWNLPAHGDLIAAWRGAEILSYVGSIKGEILRDVYFTGIRNPDESDKESHINPIIRRISQGVYDTLMSMLIPEKIIQVILNDQKNNSPLDLRPITDEVRAKTIRWRPEFADAGVKYPDEIDAKGYMDEKIIAKFEHLLASYAKSRHLLRHGQNMNYVESALLKLTDKGLDQTNPDVLVALAGVISTITTFRMSSGLNRYSQKIYGTEDSERDEVILQSAKWLVLNSKRFPSFGGYHSEFEKAFALLKEMFVKYFPEKPEMISA